MRLVAPLLAVIMLAACGVDGPPERPEPRPGLTFGGEVSIGITVQN